MRIFFILAGLILVFACATAPAKTALTQVRALSARPTNEAVAAKIVPAIPTLTECLSKNRPTLFLNCYAPKSHRQVEILGGDISAVRVVTCLTCMEVYGTNEECRAAEVQDYPTWVFPDGRRLAGVQSREALMALAGCGTIRKK